MSPEITTLIGQVVLAIIGGVAIKITVSMVLGKLEEMHEDLKKHMESEEKHVTQEFREDMRDVKNAVFRKGR